MTDPAIRAALDVAGKAVADTHLETGCVAVFPCCADCVCRTDAAAAIAAFLRQMDGVPLGNGVTFAALAASVEKGARDG